MAHTKGPFYIEGPSSVSGPYDDGGNYAILDANGDIIGEAFESVAAGIKADAKANALLFSAAPEMKSLLLKIRDELAWDCAIWEAELVNEIDELLAEAE